MMIGWIIGFFTIAFAFLCGIATLFFVSDMFRAVTFCGMIIAGLAYAFTLALH